MSRVAASGRPPVAPPDPRLLPRLLATAGGAGLDAHLLRWGGQPRGGLYLIDEVDRAGLRGRGGAAFPTARKLRTVASAKSRFPLGDAVRSLAGDGPRSGQNPAGQRVVVANGTECEPASSKDKALLVHAPHLVLDGIGLAAETVGAEEAILCLARTARPAIASVRTALHERARSGAPRVPIRVEITPNRFVAGEESALVHWLNGAEAKPTFVPPRPFERGVGGKPTLVNNVETLAHLALIARFGGEWYRGLGTAEEPGTALITVSGAVDRPGIFEVPFGVAFSEVLRIASHRSDAQAVLIGGYSGCWFDLPTASTLTLDTTSLSPRWGLARLRCHLGHRCGLVRAVRERSGHPLAGRPIRRPMRPLRAWTAGNLVGTRRAGGGRS